MQPLNGDNRSQRIDERKPVHAMHETGSMRLLPRFIRKTIRFVSNFSPMHFVRQDNSRTLLTALSIALVGGYFYVGETNRSQMLASASSFAGFEATKLVVEGNVNLHPVEIQALLGDQLGKTMFDFDVEEAREKINSVKWVQSSSVRKVFPDTIIIKVQEFHPFALWKVGDEVNLISSDGNVIGRAGQRHMLLPQVVGEGANQEAANILSIIQLYPELSERAEAFVRVGKRRWNIVMKSGLRVMLPESDWQESLENLRAMQLEKRLLDRELVQVDMRLPDRMIMKLREKDAEVRKTVIRDALKRDWHKT